MGISKAFSRLSRTKIITNNVNEIPQTISGTQITSGGYNYYVYLNPAPADAFTSSGNYTISRVIKGGAVGSGAAFGNADVLVVAGGGGGGGGDGMGNGGGGGSGGVRYFPNVPIPTSPVPIQVGTGGAPTGSYSGTVSGDGQPSFFGATYISYGGGGGASGDRPPPGWGSGRTKAGQGGSGGGAGTMGRTGDPSVGPGPEAEWGQEYGQGNIPPFSPPQGFPGNGGYTATPSSVGGGGGASQAGGNGFPAVINAYGGDGSPYPAFPAPVIAPVIPVPLQPRWTPAVSPTGLFGGGGGGGRAPGPDPGAFSPGGDGGGGNGAAFGGGHGMGSNAGQPGATYTGGGAGGGVGSGGQGGTGIIILRKAI